MNDEMKNKKKKSFIEDLEWLISAKKGYNLPQEWFEDNLNKIPSPFEEDNE
jgi:hypothetical protein